MLSYEQVYKEVSFYQGLTGKKPKRVYAYVREYRYAMMLIPFEEFDRYAFVGYTYPESYFPVVSILKF